MQKALVSHGNGLPMIVAAPNKKHIFNVVYTGIEDAEKGSLSSPRSGASGGIWGGLFEDMSRFMGRTFAGTRTVDSASSSRGNGDSQRESQSPSPLVLDLGEAKWCKDAMALEGLDGPPVTLDMWDAFVAAGADADADAFREQIFRGGVDPEARGAVWRYLLGVSHGPYDRAQREHRYATMKLQWTSVDERQMANHAQLRDRMERVRKDVTRTDRDSSYFRDHEGPHLASLNDILCTWCMYVFSSLLFLMILLLK